MSAGWQPRRERGENGDSWTGGLRGRTGARGAGGFEGRGFSVESFGRNIGKRRRVRVQGRVRRLTPIYMHINTIPCRSRRGLVRVAHNRTSAHARVRSFRYRWCTRTLRPRNPHPYVFYIRWGRGDKGATKNRGLEGGREGGLPRAADRPPSLYPRPLIRKLMCARKSHDDYLPSFVSAGEERSRRGRSSGSTCDFRTWKITRESRILGSALFPKRMDKKK